MLRVGQVRLVSVLQELPEALMLVHVVFQVASEVLLIELALLHDEVSSARHHFAEPRVHLMLVRAPRHSVELPKLLDVLVHGEHGRRQSLALLVDVLRALDHLVVEDLVGVDKLDHLVPEHLAVRERLCGHFPFLGCHTINSL